MSYYTPLRYPGGKRRLAHLVGRLVDASGLKDFEYAEPYAGGAAIGLTLLFDERAASIHINDLARPVYAFWHSVLHETKELCDRIENTNINMWQWRRQRKIYENRADADLIDLGFAALFLNRTNRSGIINGGVIGGKKQDGDWTLDVRFNKDDLIQRIRRIGRYASRIHLYQMDALKFTNQVVSKLGKNSFAFYDPPYIENGQDLYLNEYDVDGHRALATRVARMDGHWVVTYDHSAVKHQLYQAQRRIVYRLKYTAQDRYRGREVMFISDRVALPDSPTASSRIEMTAPSSRFSVYGRIEGMKKPLPEMDEGPKAAQRFADAVKTILASPKQSKPRKKKRPANRKG